MSAKMKKLLECNQKPSLWSQRFSDTAWDKEYKERRRESGSLDLNHLTELGAPVYMTSHSDPGTVTEPIIPVPFRNPNTIFSRDEDVIYEH